MPSTRGAVPQLSRSEVPRRVAALHVPLLVVALTLALVGCSGRGDGSAPTSTKATGVTGATGKSATPADYSTRGPYPVGTLDLSVDPSHKFMVFYPAAPVDDSAKPFSYSGEELFGAAVAAKLPGAFKDPRTVPDTWVQAKASTDGPFPVVLYSHGFGSYYRFSSRHNSHIASYGYVVIAVDHPERGLLSSFGGPAAGGARPSDSQQLFAALDATRAAAAQPGTLLHGVLDPDRLATEGHSAGGRASGAAAYDDRVDLWIGQAPAPPVPDDAVGSGGPAGFDFAAWAARNDPPSVPSLIIAADGDTAIPLGEVQKVFAWLDAPKRLAVLDRAGHNAFTDICAPIQSEGGLSDTVRALGLDPTKVPIVQLGEDGCGKDNPPAADELSVINHLTVAQLEATFGDHPEVAEASLDERYVTATFPNLVQELETHTDS